MNRTNDILDELKSMGSSLGDLPRTMPYSVPVGYFENLAASTREVINEINIPDGPAVWGKAMPHNLPTGYFEGFADNILSSVNSKKVLPGLPASVPYSVPAGYFEALPAAVLAAAKAGDPVRKTTNTIPLTRTYSFKPVRWAAAAVFLVIIGFGGFFFFQQPSSDADKILASVPKNEIQDYLQHSLNIDVDRVVNSDVNSLQVDNKEIVEYLNETGWDVVE